ncbi:MAG: CoB--CoM heterodisulfide reductase iron-sulfur subunit A family protein [Acidobacteria bacterium]|nr:MAG: CoB--CoM heterodisulfide reductase iron-sulfur subunit A family protein [Acidobacteriota bacterium]
MMNSNGEAGKKARVYVCECGPIMNEGIDLPALEARIGALPRVAAVTRYSTLCSEQGRTWLTDHLAAHPESVVVIAACSPREHGSTFMEACRKGGLNPYLLAIANIREQCAWVTADRHAATFKAERLIKSAVARACVQDPLPENEVECSTDVLIVGAGVAGLTAAHQLARAGRRVFLVERTPAIGGRVGLLGEVFPNMECSSCMIEPLMDEILHHPLIEALTYSEVESVKGSFGNFIVQVRRRARHVDTAGCYGCRTCHAACPVEIPNEFDFGLSRRNAVYIPYTGALPNASLVDETVCLRFRGEKCTACAEACPFGNIHFDDSDEITELQVGAILLATGSEPLLLGRAAAPKRVITGMMLERLVNSAGPTGGTVSLPGEEPPRSVALIYCADEAGKAPSVACSKVCCMSMAKYRHQLQQKLPDCTVVEILWERCTGGKGYREFARDVDTHSEVQRIRLTDSDRILRFVDRGNTVGIRYTQEGMTAQLNVDLVVIAPPLRGSPTNRELGALLRTSVDDHDFFVEEHRHLKSHRSLVEGVMLAGSCQGPKDVQESTAHAAAAAGEVLSLLIPGRKLKVEPATAEVRQDICSGCGICLATCPYQAITFHETRRVAEINNLLCRSCGTCAAGCPSGAIDARHFTDRQLWAEVDALLNA